MDDKSVEEHIVRLREVLVRLREAGLKLKPGKCEFPQCKLKYSGHIVSANGVKHNPEGIQEVVNWKVPKSVKEPHSFFGLAGYFHHHVKDFAKIAKPTCSNRSSKR